MINIHTIKILDNNSVAALCIKNYINSNEISFGEIVIFKLSSKLINNELQFDFSSIQSLKNHDQIQKEFGKDIPEEYHDIYKTLKQKITSIH